MTAPRRCRGTNASGEPCGSPVVGEDGFCDAHRPGGDLTMRLRAKLGGQAAHHGKGGGGGLPRDVLGALESIEDAQRWLRLIASAVGEREITHSEGQSMTVAVREWIRAEDSRLRAADLEDLIEQVAELRRGRMGPA